MYGYDEQTFETFEQFLEYLYAKYGDLGAANHASITWWGEDLHGNYLYIDGIQQLGTEGEAIANAGFSEAEQVMRAYTQNPAQVSADTIAQLNKLKQAQEATIQGSTYTNGAIQLGTQEAQGGNVLVATKPIVSDNGTPFNAPKIMTEEAIEDPTVPGTFSYLATLKALGWLQVPTWTAAVAPLLGVALGVGIYDLNPEFWEKVSRTLLPFCYDDNGTPKMPISVDENGNVHTPETAIEALRNLLIEEGAYGSGTGQIPSTNPLDVPEVSFVKNSIHSMTYNEWYEMYDFPNEMYMCLYRVGSRTYATLIFASDVQVSGTRTEHRSAGTTTSTISNSMSYTYNGKTVYYNYYTYYPTNYGGSINTVTFSSELNQVPSGSMSGNQVQQVAWLMVYGDYYGGSGIEGATIEQGATYPTDTTKNLAEIYPTWAGNAINVVNNPNGTTIEDSTEKWYPVSLSNTNYSNDTNEVSSTQTQTDAQSGTNTDSAQLNQIAQALQELTQTLTESGVLPPNPTIPSDPSGDTPTPTPPVITGAGSDLIAIYNPTKAQIQAFNQFLWDLDPTNLVNWKKVIANPIDAVISLHMVYVTPITGESRNIKCGYIETTVASKIVTNQYVDIDCGTVDITEYFHNVWDYDATRIEIYLPFIGIVPLHVGDIMNSTVRVRYRVDVLTGTCLAQIIVLRGNSLATLYTYTGNCAVSLPLTSGSFTGVFSTLLSMGSAGLTGGVGGAVVEGATSLLQGRVQQNIQRSGSIGANAGAMGIRTPYIIINRNVPLDAYLYQNQYGFPANKTISLGDMHGYTRVKDIHLAGIPCTDDELEQIETLLKEGVIFN